MRLDFKKAIEVYPIAWKSFLFFLILFGVLTCDAMPALEQDSLSGPVKVLHWKQYDDDSPWAVFITRKYDRSGRELEATSGGEHEGEIISSITYINVYDADGQKIKMTEMWQDGTPNIEVLYAYDKQGKKTMEVSYRPDGSFVYLFFYVYDRHGNWIEEYRYRSNGPHWFSSRNATHRYDDQGRKAETVILEQDGSKRSQRYNKKAQIIESKKYDLNGRLEKLMVFTYNGHGDEKETQIFDGQRDLLSHIQNHYDYDAYGNWVKRISKRFTKNGEVFEKVNNTDRTITYYVNDNAPS
ncbi:MAG: hypothetical protein NPIRA05_06930 [Nitrospirales bacterium]|nr:MAG: hypothetical protein NPIRA05_06930 [Nitrospirales bacterium]